tara:strand:+ start:1179 stop:2312 length:1134 start_codon:yes stop_codon:yes gene_type:complete
VSDNEMNKLGVNKDFVAKSNYYNIEKLKISIVSTMISISIIYFILFLSGLDVLNYYSLILSNNMLNQELIIIILFYLAITLINLPINFYKTFVIEEKFGFNKSSKKLFIKDSIVSTVLSLLIVILLFKSFEYLYYISPNFWWFYVWLLFIFTNLLIAYIFPTIIAPMFNRFKRLDNNTLSESINELTIKTDFPITDLYVMDGSKRSSHSNAYFTGVFGKKRIVFFDTLLKILDKNEIKSVLAHEIGHYKKKHVLKSTLLFSFLSLIFLFIFYNFLLVVFANNINTYAISSSSIAILFILISPMLSFFLMPLLSSYSRKNEFEADDYAKSFTNYKDLISSLLKLYKGNLSLIKSSKLYSIFYYSHPSVFDRISNLEKK